MTLAAGISIVRFLPWQIKPGDEVLFYFAGHEGEVEGCRFLLPSDVPVINYGDESFLISESIAADRIQDTFKKRGARTTVTILDACRNNSFASDGKRSIGGKRGLVRMSPPRGRSFYILPGQGRQPWIACRTVMLTPTQYLHGHCCQGCMTLHQLAKQVRRDVQNLASTANHDQFPAYYDQMSGDLFLARTTASATK